MLKNKLKVIQQCSVIYMKKFRELFQSISCSQQYEEKENKRRELVFNNSPI